MTNLEFYKEEIKKNLWGKQFDTVLFNLWYDHHPNVKGETSYVCVLNWLCEEHPILDKEEKEYLSAVIRPFGNIILTIEKNPWLSGNETYEYLKVRIDDTVGSLKFPLFKKGTMYKGMEVNKQYTLEELGLWLLIGCGQNSS